jgi:ERCC4-related helicase
MSVFQRRLASSTFALLRSFERRIQRLDGFIEDIKSGRITIDALQARQRQIDRVKDIYEEKTADEETTEEGLEENEKNEEQAMGGVVATSLAELETERVRVQGLLDLARKVYEDPRHEESKFAKLRELFDNPKFRDEKLIIFTEHKDTLLFLVRRLEGLGYTGQVAQIHGGMDYKDRDKMVEFFRRSVADGGARFLIATDAAGE